MHPMFGNRWFNVPKGGGEMSTSYTGQYGHERKEPKESSLLRWIGSWTKISYVFKTCKIRWPYTETHGNQSKLTYDTAQKGHGHRVGYLHSMVMDVINNQGGALRYQILVSTVKYRRCALSVLHWVISPLSIGSTTITTTTTRRDVYWRLLGIILVLDWLVY